MKDALTKAGFVDAQAVARTRVRLPLVTFTDAVTGIGCDLTFDNLLPTHNTRMFYTCA